MARKQSATEPLDATDVPDARSHLPERIERRLLKPYAGTALSRIVSGSTLRALSVLLRKHPRAALHVLASGTAAAGRIGWSELRYKLASLPDRILPTANAKSAAEKASAAAPEAALRPSDSASLTDLEAEIRDFPPEMLQAARSEIVAGLSEAELEEARKLLREADRRPTRPAG